MKKKISLVFFLILLVVFSTTCKAEVFYNIDDYADENIESNSWYNDYADEDVGSDSWYNDYADKNFGSDSLNNEYATENIRDYDVEIHVNKDASMEVTEKITVYSRGNEIKHGIYRDFPTQYNNKRVTLDVQEVLYDNENVKYTLEGVDRGVRIKIGDVNINVPSGLHTYTIKYNTERQMAFYDDYDELYWNIIGSGWNFEIESCHAKIYFPEGTEFLDSKIKTYTGPYGTKDSNINVRWGIWESQNAIEFDVGQSLNKNEAFTVSVCFEKGAIDEPSFETKFKWFVEDNCIAITILLLLILLIIWQYFVWRKHGKDPVAKVIIPKYYPPEGFDPADVGYIEKMGNTTNALEATMLNLAVKGYIKFYKENKKSNMVIEKIPKENAETELSPNEYAVYKKLKGKETLKYSASLQSRLSSLRQRFRNKLKEEYDGKLFVRNDNYKVISVVASIVIIVISAIVGETINPYATAQSFLFMFGATFLSVFIIVILYTFKPISKNSNLIGKILIFLVFLLFFGYMIVVMTVAVVAIVICNIFVSCAFIALFIDNYLFIQLIKRYTEDGQIVKEDIEGFKMFINTAKDDDFADKTPEMFDKYFPYAYVLGLQNKWAEKFEDVLKESSYVPNWCSDGMFDNGTFNVVVFTNSFSSSFSSGVSSASTAPSSSGGSGGGGGGFSGGGGGGRWPEVAGNAY